MALASRRRRTNMKTRRSPTVAAFPRALAAVQRALDRGPTPGAMMGGVAVIARGVARFTEDIDATVVGADLDVPALLKAFRREKIKPRIPDWLELMQQSQVLLLVHEPTGIEVDVSMAWLPFETDAITSAEIVHVGNVKVRAVTPTALTIYKLIAHRPQDLVDVERLWSFHPIDVRLVTRVLSQLSEHLEGPNRLETLARLRRTALKPPLRRAVSRRTRGAAKKKASSARGWR
jgi:hypothetical protein